MHRRSILPLNTPTRIIAISKTLIDDTFCYDFTKYFTVGNIAISISDHLTQFLIIEDQTTNLKKNRGKEPQKLENLIGKISYQILKNRQK